MSEIYRLNQYNQYQKAGSQICYISPEDAQGDNPGHFVRVLSYETLANGCNRIIAFELVPITELVYGGEKFEYEVSK